MLNTTIGQLLVNDALPDELRDHNRVLDKKGMHKLLEQVAREHPEKYREISFKLNQVGQRAAQDQGGMSFSARHLKRSRVADETRMRIQGELSKVLENDDLSDQERADNIVRIVGSEMEPQQKAILEEAIKDKNPLAMQVLSGSRGKPMNLASLLGGDMLYSDHRDEVIPIPVLSSYSEGLTPEEYWAGTYGARRGIIATKFATQDAGFLSKQLNQAGHRLVVMDEEGDDDPNRGMIADTDDMDNEGALLSRDVGPYKRNTPLTPKILKHLKRLGKNRILVRSPLVGGSPEGGVYARDVGVRETGKLPGRGEQVGLQAAQALSEPISQGQLSAKHSGGVAGQEKAVGGFQAINQLIQVPKKMRGGAAHAEKDGRVQRIEEAPAGGHYVTVNDQQHYVGDGYDLKVKKGDEVEAGDLMSNGIPNPALIVKHKGVGEGRRYFVNEFRKSMADSGMQGHRRNIEILARGLINHVKMTDETDDHAPDDIIPYSTLEHTYKPRKDHQVLNPKKAVGQYLERPVLHYSIGTKIRPSMLKDFEEFEIDELPVHRNPPPFQPHMVRGMYQLQHDPDWMTQMYGSGLKKSLLDSTARGATSEARGTSFVSSLAEGTDFGEDPNRAVIQPEAPYELPKLDNELKPEAPAPVPVPELPKPTGDTFFGGRFKLGMAKKALDAPKLPKAVAPKLPKAPTNLSSPSAMSPNVMPSGASPLKTTPTPPAASLPVPPAPAPPAAATPAPMQAPNSVAPPVAAPTPPPASPAQARTDQVQRSRSYRSGNPLADIQTMFSGAAPARNLAGNDLTRDMSRNSARALGVEAARKQTVQMMLDESATRNQQPQRPKPVPKMAPKEAPYEESVISPPVPRQIPEDTTPPGGDPFAQPEAPAESEGFSSTVKNILDAEARANAGKGNTFDPNSSNNIARLGSAAALTRLATRNRIASGVAGRAATKAPLLARAIPGTVNAVRGWVVPGANIGRAAAGGAGVAAAGGGVGAGALGTAAAVPGVVALGGFAAVNAATELVDAAGLLPEALGGTGTVFTKGTDALGWDQQSFDQSTTRSGYLSSSGQTLMNPLKGIVGIGAGAGEAIGAGAGAVRNIATWSTPESRNVAAEKEESQNMARDEQAQLAAQKDQIRKTLGSKSTALSPEQKLQLKRQHAELDARIQDSIDSSDAMTDETEDWVLGKQHNWSKGGHYFRDAIIGTQTRLTAKIKAIERSGNLTQRQQFDLENMKQRRNEAGRLKQKYNREVGYFGVGDFTKVMRLQVRGSKQQLVSIRARMREPDVKRNPKLMDQLLSDYQHHQFRLNNARSWAEQAKSRKVK